MMNDPEQQGALTGMLMAEEIKDGKGEDEDSRLVERKSCGQVSEEGGVGLRVTDGGGVGCSVTIVDISIEKV